MTSSARPSRAHQFLVKTASKGLSIASFDRRFGCIVLAVPRRPRSRPQNPAPASHLVHGVCSMWRPTLSRPALPVGLATLGLSALLLTAGLSGQAGQVPSTKNGEWPHYTADLRGT